jgi:hypothetical protein
MRVCAPWQVTFEAVIDPGGTIKYQYLDMCRQHASWSSESIGFEDQTGTRGPSSSHPLFVLVVVLGIVGVVGAVVANQ